MYRAGRGIQACNQGRSMGLGIMKHRTVVIGAKLRVGSGGKKGRGIRCTLFRASAKKNSR